MSRTAVFPGIWICVSGLIVIDLSGAGSVGVLRLEWRGICGACRFLPRSWSAGVCSSKSYVVDHFKLKSRDGVFGWKFIKDFSEFAHTQMEKVWSRIILVHNNFFFKVFRCLLVKCTGSLLLLFFQLPYHYFSLRRQKVLTQWAQPSTHYPRSYHHLFFIGTNSMFACFQMYVKNTFFLLFFFFFNFHMIFFLATDMCWLSRRNHLYITRSHPTECVYCSAQYHFVFWKSIIFFLQVSTWRRQCGYLPRTSWKWPESKTNRVWEGI